jgi:hypothetical protein
MFKSFENVKLSKFLLLNRRFSACFRVETDNLTEKNVTLLQF